MSWLESRDLPDYTQAQEVRIYAQKLNLVMQNPKRIPIYVGNYTLPTPYKDEFTNVSGLYELVSSSGYRGRLIHLAFDITPSTPVSPSDLGSLFAFYIGLDGHYEQYFVDDIAALNGLIHETKATTSAWVHSDFISPKGGLTAIHYDSSGNIDRVMGILILDCDWEDAWDLNIQGFSSNPISGAVWYWLAYYI